MSHSTARSLHFYLGVADRVILFVPFLGILWVKLDLHNQVCNLPTFIAGEASFQSCFMNEDILAAILGAPSVVLLWALVYRWFRNYRNAVGNELSILESVYTPDRSPHDWDSVWGRITVPILSVGFSIGFLAMAWFSDSILIFCFFMFALYAQDLIGNSILKRNLRRYFADPRFDPNPADPSVEFVRGRRAVAIEYWIDRPQVERVAVMLLATNLIIVFAATNFFDLLGGDVADIQSWEFHLAAVLIAVVIIGNEFIMIAWRRVRDRALRAIENEQRELVIANTKSLESPQSEQFASTRRPRSSIEGDGDKET
ncbi:MAG: hypothetical protein AAGP08_13810 [Pseudomonadota bacterium]